VVRTSRRL